MQKKWKEGEQIETWEMSGACGEKKRVLEEKKGI